MFTSYLMQDGLGAFWKVFDWFSSTCRIAEDTWNMLLSGLRYAMAAFFAIVGVAVIQAVMGEVGE